MFRLTEPAPATVARLLEASRDLPSAAPAALTLANGLLHKPPGFAHDVSQSELGRGPSTFLAARQALQQWIPFDLGWVRVADPALPLDPGRLVAVIAHTAGLWSVNISRILETLDTSTRFGFLYATTPHHAELGSERFLVEFDPSSGVVTYRIEAISRPRYPLVRLAYPFARATQHRFARDSHHRMQQWTASRVQGQPKSMAKP